MSTRTIMADINYLRDYFGYDIEYDSGIRSYVLRSEGGNLAQLQLKGAEWAAIQLAGHIYETIGVLPMAEAIGKIAERVRALMPELLGTDPAGLAPALSVLKGPAPAEPLPHFDLIDDAVRNQRTLRIRYHTAYRNATTERDIDPYRVTYQESRGYVIAWCHRREEVAIFRMDRILACEATGNIFLVRSDFDLEEFMGPMFGIFKDKESFHVKVRFSPFVANWIKEDVWHPTQTITELANGSVQVDITVTGMTSVKKWILGFGSDAEVLEPVGLRRLIEYEVERMGVVYGR